MDLATIHRGDSPLVIDVPHAGLHVPDEIASRLSPQARALPDTDWHVEKLYAFARVVGATLVAATHSRYVVDLNRPPSGEALYAGADNTELCPTRTFASERIYVDAGLRDDEIASRRTRYFEPYHSTLAAEIERVRARHAHAVLLDGHSIRAEVPRFFAGRLPDLNLGTVDGASCAPAVQTLAATTIAAARGFGHVVNGRFKGGYVTRRYGEPGRGVHALQLEIAQACYMDEASPAKFDEARAAPLIRVLRELVDALMQWQPR
jgi:N-formylglutamate amidohydrolase